MQAGRSYPVSAMPRSARGSRQRPWTPWSASPRSRLSSAKVAALMGDISEAHLVSDEEGGMGGHPVWDTLTRVSALIGIFKGLRLLFSEPLSDEWVRLPNGARSTAAGARSRP